MIPSQREWLRLSGNGSQASATQDILQQEWGGPSQAIPSTTGSSGSDLSSAYVLPCSGEILMLALNELAQVPEAVQALKNKALGILTYLACKSTLGNRLL